MDELPNLLGPSMFKFRSLVLVSFPCPGISKLPVVFGLLLGLSVLIFLRLRLILLVFKLCQVQPMELESIEGTVQPAASQSPRAADNGDQAGSKKQSA